MCARFCVFLSFSLYFFFSVNVSASIHLMLYFTITIYLFLFIYLSISSHQTSILYSIVIIFQSSFFVSFSPIFLSPSITLLDFTFRTSFSIPFPCCLTFLPLRSGPLSLVPSSPSTSLSSEEEGSCQRRNHPISL